MPNFFAHLSFGRLVLDALPRSLQSVVGKEKQAYFLGQYGPDPLFFYHPLRPSRAARLGRQLHRQPVALLLPSMARAVEAHAPFAAGYAAGLLCHFALDSRCHAYVKGQAGSSSLLHTAIESEFDRFIMARQGLDPARQTPMPVFDLPDAFYETLSAWFYPGIERDGYRRGLALYRRLTCWHTRCAGRGLLPLGLVAAARWWPTGALARDMALKRSPGSEFDRHNRRLLALLEGEVLPAAERVEQFFRGGPPTEWHWRDFYGRAYPCVLQDPPPFHR